MHCAMKAYGEVVVQFFLNWALVGDEWSASPPGLFTPREIAPGALWIGGWTDHRAGLDDMER
jgi:hypothetical protein